MSLQPPVPVLLRAYARVSTDEQAEEGDSLAVQVERVKSIARGRFPGWQIIVYEDDGYSGKDLNRPAIQRLMAEVQPGDVVMPLRLDRLTRKVLDLHMLMDDWQRRGIVFSSATEPYDTATTEGKFMIGLIALMAEWERDRIGERVREVMAGIMRSGDARPLTRGPIGYDKVEENYVVNQTEADLVRLIFGTYLSGKGTRAVAQELNARGYRTREGALWSDFAVSYVLRNPVYTGKLAWNRITQKGRRRSARTAGLHDPGVILADGPHEAIISLETWQAAQDLLASRSAAGRSATGIHALSGIARCARCGGTVNGLIQRRYKQGQHLPHRDIKYYRCNRQLHFGTCDAPYWRAEMVEAVLLEQLGDLAEGQTLGEVVSALLQQQDVEAHHRRVGELHRMIRRLENRKRRWDEAYEREEVDPLRIGLAEWQEQTGPIRREIEQARAELAEVTAEIPEPVSQEQVSTALQDLPALWAELGPEERKVVIQGLLDSVEIHPDGAVTPHLKR